MENIVHKTKIIKKNLIIFQYSTPPNSTPTTTNSAQSTVTTTSSTSTLPAVSTSDCPPPHPGSHEGRPSTTWTPPVQKPPDGPQVRIQLIKLLIWVIILYILLLFWFHEKKKIPFVIILVSRKKKIFFFACIYWLFTQNYLEHNGCYHDATTCSKLGVFPICTCERTHHKARQWLKSKIFFILIVVTFFVLLPKKFAAFIALL